MITKKKYSMVGLIYIFLLKNFILKGVIKRFKGLGVVGLVKIVCGCLSIISWMKGMFTGGSMILYGGKTIKLWF